MKKIHLLLLALAAVFIAFSEFKQPTKVKTTVSKELIGTYKDKDVYLFTLTNKPGNIIKLTNYGARISWIEVPDRNGKKENVTLGSATFDGMVKGDPFSGAVIGRYANRIAYGKFTLDGTEYSLPINNGKNSLHGGPGGWFSVVWDAEIINDGKYPSVRFSYMSPDMESGYPGNIKVEATYTWTDKNELIIDYKCSTDKKTVLNITNHAYFNLHGGGNGDVLDHQIVIRADKFMPVDKGMIPTGELRPVAGTPFDFTTAHAAGERINEQYDQLIIAGGYDHTFVFNNSKKVDATVYDPASGRLLELITDQPGVQFFCRNIPKAMANGSGGRPSRFRSGLCLETGHFPDSPNHPDFPTTIINPGETFQTQTIYRFSVK